MVALFHNNTRFFAAIVILALTGCSSSPAKNSTPVSTGNQVAQLAKQLIGKPYQYGGNTPKGFDCSGLVQYTHNKVGISIPRTTDKQLKQAKPIKRSQLQAGDLVFFRLNGRKVSHVGIYIGNNQIVHAPSSGKRVSYARLDQGYWKDRVTATARFY